MFQRRQLIEIHEQPWCPRSLRDGVTDALQLFTSVGKPFAPLEERLAEAIRKSGASRVIDLCSGAGGPWLQLAHRVQERMRTPLKILLTDLHPNQPAFERARAREETLVSAHPEPVDARAVPLDLGGFRTLFSSFHHFAPEDARRLIEGAVSQGDGIAIFEAQERRLPVMLFFLLYVPLCIAAAPFMKPFRWSRLFWTYVIPALPLVLTADAIVSCLRTYTPDELRELAESAHQSGICWKVGQTRASWLPLRVTYLIGIRD